MRKSLGAVLLLCLGLGLGCRPGAPGSKLDLCGAFPGATVGPVFAPHQYLGSFAARPFLDAGWSRGSGDFRSTLTRASGSSLRFYLTEPLDVSVHLEGRALDGPLELPITLNDAPWQTLKLGVELAPTDFAVEAKQLRAGLNTLTLYPTGDTQWRDFRVTPRDQSHPFKPAQVVGDTLEIPFGASLAYPLNLQPGSSLSLDDLKAWVEPGAPSPGKSALEVRIRARGVETSLAFSEGGKQQLSGLEGDAIMTLRALHRESLAPGQTGLLLKAPRIVSPTGPPATAARPATKASPKTNVILYVIDTLRADHLGCYGYKGAHTPSLDALSKDSVVFENCQAQSGWTKASTASILTSLLPREHQALDFGDKIAPSVPLLQERLGSAGYETCAAVANAFVTESFGFARGFKRFDYLPDERAAGLNHKILPWLRNRQPGEEPFFLYVHSIDPHCPYHSKSRPGSVFSQEEADALQATAYREEFSGRPIPGAEVRRNAALEAYDGAISDNDAALGELLAALKSTGQYDNTLIVVVSDHGEEFLDHGRVGHINSLYQELVHVPLILKFPGSEGAGQRVSEVWQQIDILPTILAVTGVPALQGARGHAFLPSSPEKDSDRPAVFSMKVGVDAQLFGQGRPRLLDIDSVRCGKWVLHRTLATYDPRNEYLQLFDLSSDPGEKKNLAFAESDTTIRLTALLPRRDGMPEASPPEDPHAREEVKKMLRSLQYLK